MARFQYSRPPSAFFTYLQILNFLLKRPLALYLELPSPLYRFLHDPSCQTKGILILYAWENHNNDYDQIYPYEKMGKTTGNILS